jgi:hypothetical protein
MDRRGFLSHHLRVSRQLDEKQWRAVLTDLAAKMPSTPHPPHVMLIGGVALALGYGSRRTTEDADVIMTPAVAAEVLPAAECVAAQYGLPSGWMNTKAVDAGYVVQPVETGKVVLNTASVVFEVPSTPHLLAMKLSRFAGDTDIKDAKILLRELRSRYSDAENLWDFIGGLVVMAKRDQARHNLDVLWEMLDEPA